MCVCVWMLVCGDAKIVCSSRCKFFLAVWDGKYVLRCTVKLLDTFHGLVCVCTGEARRTQAGAGSVWWEPTYKRWLPRSSGVAAGQPTKGGGRPTDSTPPLQVAAKEVSPDRRETWGKGKFWCYTPRTYFLIHLHHYYFSPSFKTHPPEILYSHKYERTRRELTFLFFMFCHFMFFLNFFTFYSFFCYFVVLLGCHLLWSKGQAE